MSKYEDRFLYNELNDSICVDGEREKNDTVIVRLSRDQWRGVNELFFSLYVNKNIHDYLYFYSNYLKKYGIVRCVYEVAKKAFDLGYYYTYKEKHAFHKNKLKQHKYIKYECENSDFTYGDTFIIEVSRSFTGNLYISNKSYIIDTDIKKLSCNVNYIVDNLKNMKSTINCAIKRVRDLEGKCEKRKKCEFNSLIKTIKEEFDELC